MLDTLKKETKVPNKFNSNTTKISSMMICLCDISNDFELSKMFDNFAKKVLLPRLWLKHWDRSIFS